LIKIWFFTLSQNTYSTDKIAVDLIAFAEVGAEDLGTQRRILMAEGHDPSLRSG
jgi:hypothetical protein